MTYAKQRSSMKEQEFGHYTDSIIYLIEQTNIYCRTKSEQFFESLNIGLNMDQYTILDTVEMNAGICQMELSKLILKDRSYTSRLLNILEEKGFIKRKTNTAGKRLVKELYITKKGKQILLDYNSKLKNTFLDVFKEIPDEEFAEIRKGLEKMKACIGKYTIMQL